MNDNISKLTNGVICLVVVVLLIAVTIIPVIEDAQKDQYSTDNNTNEKFVISNDSVTASNPLTLAMDGEYISINGVTDTQAYVSNEEKIWALNTGIRVMKNGTEPDIYYNFQTTVWSDQTTSNTYSAYKLVYDGSTLTGYSNVDAVLFTVDSDFLIYPYSKGTYGEFDMRTATVRNGTHINKDATVYVGSAGNNYGFMKGNYTDGFTTVGYSGSSTLDTRTLSYSPVLSDDGLTWRFSNTPSMTLSDSAGVLDPSSTNWILIYAPIEYSYISGNDSMIISLLGVIPLVMFIIPVMLAVNMITPRRD